jgi:hypothetical protein
MWDTGKESSLRHTQYGLTSCLQGPTGIGEEPETPDFAAQGM